MRCFIKKLLVGFFMVFAIANVLNVSAEEVDAKAPCAAYTACANCSG
jgi:hypothetical protein